MSQPTDYFAEITSYQVLFIVIAIAVLMLLLLLFFVKVVVVVVNLYSDQLVLSKLGTRST